MSECVPLATLRGWLRTLGPVALAARVGGCLRRVCTLLPTRAEGRRGRAPPGGTLRVPQHPAEPWLFEE